MTAIRYLLTLLVPLTALPASADEVLWQRLQTEPNLVVLIRHTEVGEGNSLVWDESGQCRGERRLNDAGKAHAKKVGELFRAKRITPTVISSPMCRCRETAELAFGTYRTDPLLREVSSANEARVIAFQEKARELLLKARGKAPVVFISHRPNIDLLALELIDTDELLVARILDSGELDVIGQMHIKP